MCVCATLFSCPCVRVHVCVRERVRERVRACVCVCVYLAEAPVLAASDEAGRDLTHAALGALVGVVRQHLQARPEQRQEHVAIVTEEPLSITTQGGHSSRVTVRS